MQDTPDELILVYINDWNGFVKNAEKVFENFKGHADANGKTSLIYQ